MKFRGMIGLAMAGTLLAESVKAKEAVQPHLPDDLLLVAQPQTLVGISVTGSYAAPALTSMYSGH